MLVLEAEIVVFVGLRIIAHRVDLFIDLQPDIPAAAVLVSLIASSVFAWREDVWSTARTEGSRDWGGAATTSYAEKIAERGASNQPQELVPPGERFHPVAHSRATPSSLAFLT